MRATQATQASSVKLRTAAVWGTTVLALENLESGQSFRLGEGEGSVLPVPDGSHAAELPIRAVGNGWELDARGVTGGTLYLRGRQENPVDLARSGAPIPIVAGDHGLLQYNSFAVFFQFTDAAPKLRKRRYFDWALILSFVFASVAVLGGLALVWAITTPPAIPKPLELTSQRELALQYRLDFEELEPEPELSGKDSEQGGQRKDPGAKDPKPQGGGKKIKGPEGSLGRKGKALETELKGDPREGLGGMAEVLSSDVGEEVKKTLGTISSVADALGGLSSDKIVLGRGSGTGLRGGGNAGGGKDSGGVPFGSGTLDTGWGAGRSGGFGSGSGGAGKRGLGGTGRGTGSGKGDGNSGTGDGTGGGERKLAGKASSRSGQGLTQDQVRRVVMSRYGAFRACYESALSRSPNLQGTVSVSFHISPAGSVDRASIAGSSLSNARVEGCLVRLFKRLRFPRADKGTSAGWPFAFKPSKR